MNKKRVPWFPCNVVLWRQNLLIQFTGKPKKHNIDKAVKKQKTEPEEVVLVKAKPKKVKEEVPPKKVHVLLFGIF